MSAPTAVSLFAGVGGIDVALDRAGFKVKAAVEINAAARGVIADRMPETTLFDDVTKVTADDLLAAGFDPRTGIITAGFPCQDLSVAGRRRGLASGTRSGLWWHVARLLADLRPRWFIGENVPGLLSACCPCLGDGACETDCPGELHPVTGGACGPGRCMVEHGGAMGAVLGSVADLGYGIAYRILDSQHFGVPQRRRRVVIVGCLGDDRRPVQVLLEPEGRVGDPASRDQARTRVAATLTGGSSGAGVSAPGRRAEDDVNLVVAPALTARYGKGVPSSADDAVVVSTLQAGGGKRGYRIDAESAAGGQLVVVPPLTASMGSNAGHPGDSGKDEMVLAVTAALGGITHALTAEGHDASEDGTGRGTPVIAFDPKGKKSGGQGVLTETTVRRLTPRECERLQGFDDDWTATSNGKVQADSPRYQQCGNAVAVPVFEWVARRIVSVA